MLTNYNEKWSTFKNWTFAIFRYALNINCVTAAARELNEI